MQVPEKISLLSFQNVSKCFQQASGDTLWALRGVDVEVTDGRSVAVMGRSAALAMIFIFIINRAFFGQTIDLHWPWTTLLEEAVAIVAASVLGSVYPAPRASRTPATELRRDDL